jgi:iron complex outermembrane receptor protein
LSATVQSADGQPLPGATVELNPGKVFTSSSATGAFTFSSLCPGSYIIRIRYLGYESFTDSLMLSASLQTNFTLTPVATVLHEIEVHDHFLPVSEVQSFQALSGTTLERLAGKSLGETLKEIPGVNTVQTGPAIFKPVIHGLQGTRILMLNNGLRQEGQQWGAEHAPEIDPFIASNLIVVKDASAITYGSDALGGVILVNPPDLPERKTLGGALHGVTQSNGRSATLSGMLEGGSDRWKGFGWRVQSTGRRAGDFHTPDYNLTNTGFSELNYSAALGIHRDEKGIDVFFSRFKTNLGILKGSSISSTEDLENAMEREPPQYTRPFSYTIENPQQEVGHTLLKLNAHKHALRGDVRLRYGFQYNTRKEFDIRRDSMNEIPSINLELITNTVDLEWLQHAQHPLTSHAGINLLYQINNNIPGTQRIPFIPDFTTYSGGLFYVGKTHLDVWRLEAGVRADYRYYRVAGFDFANRPYASTYGFGSISSTLGVSRPVGTTSRILSSISLAWRPPHVSELYSLGVHQSAAAIEYGLLLDEETTEVQPLDGSGVKNEQALKWVSTWDHHTTNWHMEISGYINTIFNYIYLRPEGVTGTIRGVYPYFRYIQTDAWFTGIDVLTVYNGIKFLSLEARASLLWAGDHTNRDYLIYIPPHTAQLEVEWEKPLRHTHVTVFLGNSMRAVAQQQRAPRVLSVVEINDAYEMGVDLLEENDSNFDFMPAPEPYALWNAEVGVSKRFSNTKADVRIKASNLLDHSYREYTNRMRYYADEIGRSFSLQLSFSL